MNYITTHFDKFEHIYRISKMRRLNFSSLIRFDLIYQEKVHFNINPIKRSISNQVFGKSKVISSILTRIHQTVLH